MVETDLVEVQSIAPQRTSTFKVIAGEFVPFDLANLSHGNRRPMALDLTTLNHGDKSVKRSIVSRVSREMC